MMTLLLQINVLTFDLWYYQSKSAPSIIHFPMLDASWSFYAHILLHFRVTGRWDKHIGFSIFYRFLVSQYNNGRNALQNIHGEKWLWYTLHCKLKIGRGFEIQECPKAAGMDGPRHRRTPRLSFGFNVRSRGHFLFSLCFNDCRDKLVVV